MAEEFKQQFERTRTKCPFYGFCYMGFGFIDQEGNQCAAQVNSYSPCSMEMSGKAVDWKNCPMNDQRSKQFLEDMMDSCRIFPHEFNPSGTWSGMPFRNWYNHIMEIKS